MCQGSKNAKVKRLIFCSLMCNFCVLLIHFNFRFLTAFLYCDIVRICYAGCFKKGLYKGIPKVTVWRVLRKRLHLKAYKRSIILHLKLFLKHPALPMKVTLNRNYPS
jgi:hypothetical protein